MSALHKYSQNTKIFSQNYNSIQMYTNFQLLPFDYLATLALSTTLHQFGICCMNVCAQRSALVWLKPKSMPYIWAHFTHDAAAAAARQNAECLQPNKIKQKLKPVKLLLKLLCAYVRYFGMA